MVRKENEPYSNDDHLEETSTEFDPDLVADPEHVDDSNNLTGLVVGWLAIISSLIAFFLLPLFFAALGVIGGVIANLKDNASLGYTAITLAILAFIVRFFISPF